MSSKDDKIAKDRTAEDESPPVKVEKARRGASKGKRSWKAKDEKFREKVGSRVKSEIRADIDRRTHSELDDIINQLTRLCIDAVPLTVQLPITTRALGLLVNVSYDAAKLQIRTPPALTKNQFYRVTLAQLHLQLIRAAMERKGSYVREDELMAQFISAPFFQFENTIMSGHSDVRVSSRAESPTPPRPARRASFEDFYLLRKKKKK